MAGRVFINYRRGDDPGFTQALYQRLELLFARDQLFFDLGGHIQPGDDFVEVLSEQVRLSNVVLVVIGPRWATLLEQRRDDPEDFVLIEIRAALEQGKRIIPVLVSGARMPSQANLPPSIQALSRRHAVELRPERFAADCEALCQSIQAILSRPSGLESRTDLAPSIQWEAPSSVEFTHQFTMSAAYLRWTLEKLSFAMSADANRYYLNGIYLHPGQTPEGGPILNVVATDGHRLTRVSMASVPGLADVSGTIIPRTAVPDILTMLVGASGTVRIGVAPGAMRFEAQGLRYQTVPIDGVYPNYGGVFPSEAAATASLSRSDLIQAIVRLVGDSTIGGEVRAIHLTTGEGSIELSLPSESAALSTRISVSGQTGSRGLSVGLNPRYLVEILRRVDGERVEIALATSMSPVIFRDPSTPALVFVLMPIKL